MAVVTASQNAARPGSVEQAPQVLGSPVHTGSAGVSVTVQSFLLGLPFDVDLSDSGTEAVTEYPGGEAGCVTVYQSFLPVPFEAVRLR